MTVKNQKRIEEVQLTMDNLQEVKEWANLKASRISTPAVSYVYFVDTLEGKMLAEIGNYIIKGTHGEFYPVKKEIFESKYEELK